MLTVLSAGRFSGKVSASVHLCISYLGSVPESGLHSFVNLQNKHFFFYFLFFFALLEGKTVQVSSLFL